jgi:hypothetical protein
VQVNDLARFRIHFRNNAIGLSPRNVALGFKLQRTMLLKQILTPPSSPATWP